MGKFFKITIMVIMALVPLSVNAYDFKVDDLYYSITSKESVEISRCDYFEGDLKIPSNILFNGRTFSVTSIGDCAFWCCSHLTSVEIPNSVTEIGLCAFEECSSLTSVKIGNSVIEIGYGAFTRCSSLKSVEIGNSVTKIDSYAFQECSNLTSVEIPNSVTSIGYHVFMGCKKLSEILVDEKNENYASIDGVLYNKDISTLIRFPEGKQAEFFVILNSVTSIDVYAFADCSCLTSVEIPNSVTEIRNSAFSSCSSLMSVYCQWKMPIKAWETVFNTTTFKVATLYVPKGCKAAYEKVDPWRNFWYIEEFDYAGIDAVESDEPATEIGRYDLLGKPVNDGYRGVVIIRYSDGTSRKVAQ